MKLLPLLALAATAALHAGESLNFSLLWPSGVALGEAHLQTTGRTAELTVDATLPGYAIHDRYKSQLTATLCSSAFDRETLHGTKRTTESITVTGTKATRQTAGGGGKTEIAVAGCAQDALGFVGLIRRELGQGKVPPPQTVLFGPGYPVRVEALGRQTVPIGGTATPTDKVVCIVTIPRTGDFRIEMFFARDTVHTPLLLRAPFALGTFSMELSR